MKKMMMMVAACAVAGAACAANLEWYVSANSYVPQSGVWYSTGTPEGTPVNTPFVYALVLAGDVSAAVTAFTAEGFTISGGNAASGVFLDWAPNTGVRGGSGTLTAPNVANAAAITTSPQNYVAIAFQQVGSDWYYLASGASAPSNGYATDPDLGTTAAFGATQFGGTSAEWTPVTPVPEPTAMALLALGAAALGLRRKLRK